MQSSLPTDEELGKLYRWTLHTQWGVSGAPVSGIGADDGFTLMFDRCVESRRDRWTRDRPS